MSAANGEATRKPKKTGGAGKEIAQPDKQTPGCESRAGTKPAPASAGQDP